MTTPSNEKPCPDCEEGEFGEPCIKHISASTPSSDKPCCEKCGPDIEKCRGECMCHHGEAPRREWEPATNAQEIVDLFMDAGARVSKGHYDKVCFFLSQERKAGREEAVENCIQATYGHCDHCLNEKADAIAARTLPSQEVT